LTRTLRQIEEHRQGGAVIEVRDETGRPVAGTPVWVEQESHEFLFGCAVPDLDTWPEAERARYRARLEEVFNCLRSPEGALRVEVRHRIHLAALRRELDRLALVGPPLDVHVGGQAVGMAERSEQDGARRVADLYALCFAHPSVRGIFWHGFWDGEEEAPGGGMLRRDLSPKPAFRALQKLVGVVWHTRAAGPCDAEGRFHFRGFWGTYRVAVMAGTRAAKVASFACHRRQQTSGPFVLEVARADLC
jgi:hypothetical protein